MYTQELDTFLKEAQQQAQTLIAVCIVGNTNKGKVLAAELCTMIANYRQAHKMAQEVESLEGLDLSALSVDLQADHPEIESDSDSFRGE